jgi:hypothetical protein
VLGTPNNGRLSVPQASRRDTPVKCAMCGRSVTRRSRQQRYCSDRCRDFARCENNGRTAIKNSVLGLDTGKPTNPPQKAQRFQRAAGSKIGIEPPHLWPAPGD